MSFLGRAKKQDLKLLAQELGVELGPNPKIIEIKNMITSSENYEDEFVQGILQNVIDERLEIERQEKRKAELAEELERRKVELADEQEKRKAEKEFELEKLRLQLEAQKSGVAVTNVTNDCDQPKFELKKLIPNFDSKEDDIAIFLNLFERQLKFLKVPVSKWVAYLIGSLPSDVAKLIARESEEESQNYALVKEMLLKRFKLSAEKFRQLFSQHRKAQESTWRDFYFELRGYFEGWLHELKISDYNELKDLIIADQIKKRVPPDIRDHFLDDWSEWVSPSEIADRLDAYCSIRDATSSLKKTFNSKDRVSKLYSPKKGSLSYRNDKDKVAVKPEKSAVSCYGCGKPGIIKSRCPNCNPSVNNDSASFGNISLHSCSSSPDQIAVLKLSVNGTWGTACADSGASHSIAGESLYRLLREKGVKFQKTLLSMSLADGRKSEVEAYTTCVAIGLEDRVIQTPLVALPYARENRTLLGTDFLRKAGIVLNLRHRKWYFCDSPRRKYDFVEEANIREPQSTIEENSCLLREEEGQNLTHEQRNDLAALLKKYESIFELGGEPTPYIEHRINTGDSPPVSVPPYRMTPAKREILKKEIDELLEKKVIEECESPYAAPVVLVPKPNGSIRLCIDYRGLNAVTVPDSYPLPRMDDLLHDAKHSPFMSTIDLKSGYHQVLVQETDRDKTAFVCPFGTFRFLRMPFGLKTAPATFQRLIDKFRSGLKDIRVLSYLDDIIVLSETFERHILDLKAVFDRLNLFKLRANREKSKFACDRVKYLGHWITTSGIEVDPEKTAVIQQMAPPKNVKQVQSFLQTCSWYRRFIPDFSKVAKPLSDLTKKNATWTWGKNEDKAFQTLKQLLVKPPILKQSDASKPYLIRTDASGYALGAVLLQGHGSDEHPVEYASRLLSAAERNYSTTEREALAVVWALNKFRGYIEGQEVTVASDHQPLRWLLSLKSPSGKLARWALQLQDYNLKIDYIPGKSNVVADMLSRPICNHGADSCELCTISIDLPTKTSTQIREEQMKDTELKKIIDTFEKEVRDENFANWTSRGYLMNQGVLYRYAPDSESEEAQLVVPVHEREKILREHHDAETAGHYGAEGTYQRISQRYYFTGMRKFISDYVKNCNECNRYKPSNQKPSGLLQTPVYGQRFETLAIDLFGPLPETDDGKKWILIVEDCTTKWVELFALPNATAKECAVTLLEEVFLRYGLPRRIISDNGTQFVSSVMQQVCYLLNINQVLTPVYHPQANPVERKNRDLKPRLAILVGTNHTKWSEKLPNIRFAMNTHKSETTGQTAAFLQFGRELRTTDDIAHDIRSVIQNDNFVAEITPYLKRFANMTRQIKELVEVKQDYRKRYADERRKPGYPFSPGDSVWVTKHPLSSSAKQRSSKFMPRRDGPFVILTQRSPTTYEVANPQAPDIPIGVYHSSALRPHLDPSSEALTPLRKRGRPKKIAPGSSPRRRRSQRGRM